MALNKTIKKDKAEERIPVDRKSGANHWSLKAQNTAPS